MKKKIIFVAFCLILFLIFTALGYGGPDPKRLKDHPWDHLLSPGVPKDTTVDVKIRVFLIPFNLNVPIVIGITQNLFSDIKDNKDIGHSSSILHEKKWAKSSKNTLKR